MEDVVLTYSVRLATPNDAQAVYDVLAKVLVPTTGTVQSAERVSRQLHNKITKCMNDNTIVVLLHNNIVVGASILMTLKIFNLIVHQNILEEHKITAGSVLLTDYVLNTFFKGKDVYLTELKEEFKSMLDKKSDTLFLIKPEVASTLRRYSKKYYG